MLLDSPSPSVARSFPSVFLSSFSFSLSECILISSSRIFSVAIVNSCVRRGYISTPILQTCIHDKTHAKIYIKYMHTCVHTYNVRFLKCSKEYYLHSHDIHRWYHTFIDRITLSYTQHSTFIPYIHTCIHTYSLHALHTLSQSYTQCTTIIRKSDSNESISLASGLTQSSLVMW